MDGFALSERWNGWSRLDTVVEAARAAIAAGPLDPLVCEVTLERDEDTVTLDDLAELDALIAAGEDPLSLEILVAHAVEGEASLRLVYNGRWLQDQRGRHGQAKGTQGLRRGAGRARARVRDHDVQLPDPPPDTVSEVRRARGVKDRDPGRPAPAPDPREAQGRAPPGSSAAGSSPGPVPGANHSGIVSVPSGAPVIPSGGQRCGYGGRFQTHCSPQ